MTLNEIFKEAQQNPNSQQLIQYLLQGLEELLKLGQPLKFSKKENSKGFTAYVIGETGNGKSTLLSWLMFEYSQMYGIPYDPNKHKFFYQASTQAITKEVSSKQIGDMILIDSPGTNDPQLSPSIVAMKIHNCLSSIIFQSGLTSVIQCIMIGVDGRIKDTTIRSMSRTLLTLTLLYPNSEIQNSIRLNVVFTNFSIYHNQILQTSLPGDENQKPLPDLLDYIKTFKQALLEQTFNELGQIVSKDNIRQKINILFPNGVFYAYKLGFEKEYQLQELKQLRKLIKDNTDHGKWVISNSQTALFEPVQMEFEVRVKIQEHLKELMKFCLQGLENASNLYNSHTKSQSKKILACIENLIRIRNAFSKMEQQCPWSLQKTPPETQQFIQTMIHQFTKASTTVAMEEISAFQTEEAKRLKEEMAQEKKKMEQKMQQFGNQVIQLEKEIQQSSQREQEQSKHFQQIQQQMKEQHKLLEQKIKKAENQTILNEQQKIQQLDQMKIQLIHVQKELQNSRQQQQKKEKNFCTLI